jgi:hypothetical protein
MYAPTGVWDQISLGLTADGPVHLLHHLSQVQFGYHECLGFLGKFPNASFREWPHGYHAEFPDFQSTGPRKFDGALCDSRRDSVRNDNYVGVFHVFFFKQGNAVCGFTNLVL